MSIDAEETIRLPAEISEHKAQPGIFLHYLREMLEAVLAMGIIAIGSWFLSGDWLPTHVIFCACFLVVFAIAVRYQKATGYSTGLLAAGVYGLLLWQRYGLQGPFHLWLEPFLLLVCGVLLSDMLFAQRRRFTLAEEKQAQIEGALHKTMQRYQAALTINTELERQIAGQTASVATISDKMAQVWQPNGKKRYDAILDMVMSALEAESCALYLSQNAQLSLYISRPAGFAELPSFLDLQDPLIRRVMQLRKVITVRDLLAENKVVSQRAALMAGPLIDRKGQVIAIVTVNRIALLKFTPNAVRLFTSLLHMASVALQTASPELETAWNEYLRWVDENETKSALPTIKPERGR
jgi:GAF domain-containing protein